MKFKVRQEVMIKRNLGQKRGYSKSKYYYGGDLSDVPLGTKAIVNEIMSSENELCLKLKNRGGYGCLHVHPDELSSNKECEVAQKKLYEEQQKKINSLLDEYLLENPAVEKKSRKKIKLFEPKFNAKDEFPVWIRQEFPKLKEYSKTCKRYSVLNKRIKEVEKAAEKAWEGVEEATRQGNRFCHRDFLKPRFLGFYNSVQSLLSKINKKQCVVALENLVCALEVSGTEMFPYNEQTLFKV